MGRLSRRDFLKLATAASVGVLLPHTLTEAVARPYAGGQGRSPNIIILLFDSMSARHLSLYGYPRETTPNLNRFAERATVYHAHWSAGNYTTPGTASMLTGLYPWTHRALQFGGLVRRDLEHLNIFYLLGDGYYRYVFSQNLLSDVLAAQFGADVDEHLPPTSFSIGGNDLLMDKLPNDRTLSWHTFQDFLFALSPYLPASLLGGYLNSINSLRKTRYYRAGKVPGHPYGAPLLANYNISYTNERVFGGVAAEIQKLSTESNRPYLAYFHLYSPHEPYKPQRRFASLFIDDGYRPPFKPHHPLAGNFSDDDLLHKRLMYDQLIANVDAEFGKLMDTLEMAGALKNTWVIVTSDHGQLFERGDHGHGTNLMNEGVLHIPLLISAPGQDTRQDVNVPTSNVDLLPTLLLLTGQEIPSGIDGQCLPGFGISTDSKRLIFAVQAPYNSAFAPLKKGSLAMRKGSYKLIAYLGYPGFEQHFELYNLEEDPEELNDLFAKEPAISSQFRDEFLAALQQANQPFLSP
jgi:arylsulfatase A-like enzyme